MDKSIEFTEFGLVHEVVSGNGSQKHLLYKRRKKLRVLPWQEESDVHRTKSVLKNGHIDVVC